MRGVYDELLSEKRGTVRALAVAAHGKKVVGKQLPVAVVFASAHVYFRIEKGGGGVCRYACVADETRVPARDYRFWQVFEIAVFLEGKLLCHARIVAAHFGEFGCCARANESHGAAVHGEPLHVAVSVDVGAAAGQDVDAGHVGELLVEIELLLHDERRAAVEFAQEAASVPVKFEAEVEIAVLTGASYVHGIGLCQIRTHFGCGVEVDLRRVGVVSLLRHGGGWI